MVLIIPSVFGLLGDNPMQSEMACHVGMAGNNFCRICKVSSPHFEEDEENGDIIPSTNRADESDALSERSDLSENGSEVSAVSGSEIEAQPSPCQKKSSKAKKRKKRRTKGGETMAEMVESARNFLSVCS